MNENQMLKGKWVFASGAGVFIPESTLGELKKRGFNRNTVLTGVRNDMARGITKCGDRVSEMLLESSVRSRT
jgi:hypothetical protein